MLPDPDVVLRGRDGRPLPELKHGAVYKDPMGNIGRLLWSTGYDFDQRPQWKYAHWEFHVIYYGAGHSSQLYGPYTAPTAEFEANLEFLADSWDAWREMQKETTA